MKTKLNQKTNIQTKLKMTKGAKTKKLNMKAKLKWTTNVQTKVKTQEL